MLMCDWRTDATSGIGLFAFGGEMVIYPGFVYVRMQCCRESGLVMYENLAVEYLFTYFLCKTRQMYRRVEWGLQ